MTTNTTSRRVVLTLVAGGAVSTAVIATAAKELYSAGTALPDAAPDPIYAAIEAHRSAWEVQVELLRQYSNGDETDAMSRALRQSSIREEEWLNALGECRPTTLQGAAEFLNYTLEILDKEGADYLDTRLATILTNVMIVVATLGGVPVPAGVGAEVQS